jgi:hypothetical protein
MEESLWARTNRFLGLKAEALYLAHRTSEALEAIEEAVPAERSGMRSWSAELHRLRGVFLAAMGAEEVQIEAARSRRRKDGSTNSPGASQSLECSVYGAF